MKFHFDRSKPFGAKQEAEIKQWRASHQVTKEDDGLLRRQISAGRVLTYTDKDGKVQLLR